MNILIDTNVLLSAALRDRLPEQVILFVATDPVCRWLTTSDIRDEYCGVLARPKFSLSTEMLDRWTTLVDMRTILVPTPTSTVEFFRDPKDIPFLACAIAGNADYLITGDKDLLEAKLSISTRIVTVTQFAAEFGIIANH
jgi:putative PIN family toxin of toxin-antitoxin system